MKFQLLRFIRFHITNKKIHFDYRVFIFLFFLIISTIFWFLNALSKNYTTSIAYPIRYKQLPKDKMLIGALPSHISLHVNAYGFSLLRFNLSKSLSPVNFDLKRLPKKYINKDSSKFYIRTDFAGQLLSEQFKTDISIRSVTPDSILFHFAKISHKTVVVVPNIDLDFQKQYILKSKIELNPDSIGIKGPTNLLEEIDTIHTRYYKFSAINDNIETKLQLDSIPGIQFQQNEINIKIPVEKYTEAQVRIPIEVINAPKNNAIKMFPNFVTIKYFVGLSKYELVTSRDFRAVVDFKELTESETEKAPVEIVKQSKLIVPQSMKYYPRKTEYIIEKNVYPNY